MHLRCQSRASLQSVRKETRVGMFHSCTFNPFHETVGARARTHTPSGASPAINHSWQRSQAFQPLGRKQKNRVIWQDGNVRSASLSSQLLRRTVGASKQLQRPTCCLASGWMECAAALVTEGCRAFIRWVCAAHQRKASKSAEVCRLQLFTGLRAARRRRPLQF